MPFTTAHLDEINLLCRFSLDTTQSGLKIHSNADARMISAAQRLHQKELITQSDGGYLSTLGQHAAQHAQQLLQILNKP